MSELYSLTYVEIDIDYCSLTYGSAPCTASIPTTGAIKCFNCLKTCQDDENFDSEPVTLRFGMSADYYPKSIPCIPSLRGESYSPAIVSLGDNLGQRASLTVQFEDHPHSDTGAGFDKYVTERPYNPWERGSFWSKFRARQPYLVGRPLRLIRGTLGQTLEQMEVRHFVIESFNGPGRGGEYSITAKDVLTLAVGERAQAPVLNEGFLSANIANNATSLTLSPAGIGNLNYPASGHAAIGGKEIVSFTRSGDVMTITRAQKNTLAQAHSAQDRVQIVKSYLAQSPAVIIHDLLTNFAGVDADYINLAEWEAEVDAYLAQLYTCDIAEPTSVQELVSELIKQAALALWWDDAAQLLRLRVIRVVPPLAQRFSDDNVLLGSLKVQEQPTRRYSQVWTYFAQRNALEGQDDPDNYRSCQVTVAAAAEVQYGSSAILKIFSRWIPFGGRSVAERLNGLQLGRFRDPPRRISFSVYKHGPDSVVLGNGYQLEARPFQDATGAREDVPIQLTSVNPGADKYDIEAEEMRFDTAFMSEYDQNNRLIVVDVSTGAINMRTLHDALYPVPEESDVGVVSVTLRIEPSVVVASTNVATPAIHVGDWPEGIDLILEINGSVRGMPGAGGAGGEGGPGSGGSGQAGTVGQTGGVAIYTRHDITLRIEDAEIFGGPGGGGGGGGSGGARSGNNAFRLGAPGGGGGGSKAPGVPGAGASGGLPGGTGSQGQGGSSGTDPTGGQGGGPSSGGGAVVSSAGDGGDAGDWGEDGTDGTAGQFGSGANFSGAPGAGAAGGLSGAAIDGISYCTIDTGPGDVRGPEIN